MNEPRLHEFIAEEFGDDAWFLGPRGELLPVGNGITARIEGTTVNIMAKPRAS